MPERILQRSLDALGIERAGYLGADEWSTFADVEFPTYLVTEQTYKDRLNKAGITLDKVRKDLRSGTPGEDAGDTHGMYHNELGWYREQLLEATANEANKLLEGLDRAVLISDYDEVRESLSNSGVDPSTSIMIGSDVVIQYGEDKDDFEEIRLVSKLDGGSVRGWVSVETPLAKAMQGKTIGADVNFRVSDKTPMIQVKIIDIK